MKKTYLASRQGSACRLRMFPLSASLSRFCVLGCFGATSCRSTDAASPSRASASTPGTPTVVTVFQAIQQQTGCSFVYNTSDIDTDRKVSRLGAGRAADRLVLDKLFAGSDIAYTLRDKHIVLSKKTKNSPPPQRSGRSQRNR